MSDENPIAKVPINRYEPPFYIAKLPSIPDKFSELLSKYSHVPEPDQQEHIQLLRNSAYERHPYPCLGRFRFLDLDLSVHPLYSSDLLPRLTAPSTGQDGKDGKPAREPLFLDIGCCIGQDLRKLAVDGVPISRLYGADLLPEFVDIGYQLFRDAATFPRDHFIAPADMLAGDEGSWSPGPLEGLVGRVSNLHVSAVFHLFEREKQVILARRCLQLLDRSAGRCLVLGADAAKVDAGEVLRADGKMRFRNNSQSWTELWEMVAAEAGVKVEVAHSMSAWHPSVDRNAAQNQSKVIGDAEQGFRWSVWSVWVDFRG